MKIGIVLHPYEEKQPAGLARTIFEFTKGLLQVDETNEYIIFLKKPPLTRPELPGKNWRVEILGDGFFWLERLRHAPQADVYIFNTPVLPLFFRPKKSIVLALDFGYILLNHAKKWVDWRRELTYRYHWLSLRRADRIVAISEATKQDTIRLFCVPPEKIDVVLCGYKKICAVPETAIALPPKFFLFVGFVKARKNVLTVVKAFHHIAADVPDHDLVIGGFSDNAYGNTIRAYIETHGLESRVHWIGHLNDGQLSFLYRRATSLVFPSLVEGFGFPVLEAMDCGIPVITSSVSSLPEVGGDAAVLVDPLHPEAIGEAMKRIANDPRYRDELIQKGKIQAARFSWTDSARQLKAIIERVAHS